MNELVKEERSPWEGSLTLSSYQALLILSCLHFWYLFISPHSYSFEPAPDPRCLELELLQPHQKPRGVSTSSHSHPCFSLLPWAVPHPPPPINESLLTRSRSECSSKSRVFHTWSQLTLTQLAFCLFLMVPSIPGRSLSTWTFWDVNLKIIPPFI